MKFYGTLIIILLSILLFDPSLKNNKLAPNTIYLKA